MPAFLLMMLSAASGLVGCATQTVAKSEVRRSSGAYEQMRRSLQQTTKIAPGNTLAVEDGGDSKISGEYKVDFDGRIQMPYKVTLKAAGLTTSELVEKIKSAYQAYVRGNYSVRVDIKDRSVWVEVRGEVKKPGRYLVRLDMPIEEIVSQADGFVYEQAGGASNPDLRPDYLHIVRPAPEGAEGADKESTWFSLSEYFTQYDTEPDFLWRGGEELFFQRSAPADANIKKSWHTITVMGEVREPKELAVLPNADLLTYISRAGGPSAAADISRVEIIHRGSDQTFTANLINDRMFNELRAGDVIVVRAMDTRPGFMDKVLTYAVALATVTLSVATLIILP